MVNEDFEGEIHFIQPLVIKGYVALLGRRHIEINLIDSEHRNLLPVVWP